MNRSLHVLAGGLAAVAVSSGFAFAPGAYASEARACGQAAVPAVFVTVVTEPVLRSVPAVTHEEWRWERTVATLEHEYSRVVEPSHSETDWTRDVPATTEYQWALKVVDQAAVPAVPGTPEAGHDETVVITPAVTRTMFEYLQPESGNTRWEDAGWNADRGDTDPGQGWVRTGATREDVVTPAVTEQRWVVDQAAVPGTPAVDEISHLEYTWATSSPGPDWTGPLSSRAIGGGTQTTTTVDGAVPAGDGWSQTATRIYPEVTSTLWAADAPDGFTPTGASRVADVSVEQTTGTSATPPAGDGWTTVTDSRVLVVDAAETTEVVSPGSVEQVELSPEQPATEACPSAADDVVASASDATDPEPTLAASVHAGSSHTATHHASAAPAAGAATVLPEAGNPVSAGLLSTGLGALLVGGLLVRTGRRKRTA